MADNPWPSWIEAAAISLGVAGSAIAWLRRNITARVEEIKKLLDVTIREIAKEAERVDKENKQMHEAVDRRIDRLIERADSNREYAVRLDERQRGVLRRLDAIDHQGGEGGRDVEDDDK